jgi:hypothetical protein
MNGITDTFPFVIADEVPSTKLNADSKLGSGYRYRFKKKIKYF